VEKALTGPVRLDPSSIENELWDRPLAGIGNYLRCGAGSGLDVDLGIRDSVLVEKALGLAAIAAPVG